MSLKLSPSWSYSAIYPTTSIAGGIDKGQSISWLVDVASSGLLRSGKTGVAISSLFWEATSTGRLEDRDAALRSFDPRAPVVEAWNSVLLPLSDLLPYLETALRKLHLTDTAATDFIQYWLGNWNDLDRAGKRIAVRFLPQQQLEAVAKLSITPSPDVVTRIFMLFKGVAADQWGAWKKNDTVPDWPLVVGVKSEASDVSKYRVLEWGGSKLQTRKDDRKSTKSVFQCKPTEAVARWMTPRAVSATWHRFCGRCPIDQYTISKQG